MRTSTRRDGMRKHVCGMTLLEVLVVMAIIAILGSLLAPRLLPSPAQQLAEESRRLELLLRQARIESIQSAQVIAVSFAGQQYRFWRWQGPDWALIEGETLRPRRLPEGMRLEGLLLEGRAGLEGEKIIYRPQGITPRFCISLRHEAGSRRQLCGTRLGGVDVREG
ncbi:GspH/FimT family pseudopilin [Chitinilyticum aquatile]|uniref:GspH/FimT family pseudopilin n=1 Tax=Chitinilyticum aquatile TaxID=362520 RepID=UPI0006871ECF|nr:type II secretion system protein [Chitinilyticum aquatile]